MPPPGPLRAGVARVSLDAPLGAAMMGYGARTGRAEARADPLFARALYLEDAGSGALLWLELDLCLLAPAQAQDVRARLAARTGLAAERVLVACTHTHSGPESGYAAWLGGVAPPAHVPALLDAAVEAGARAAAGAEPARLGLGRAEARIGCNRRVAGGPVDPEVLVLRVDAEGGAPRAVLYVHGCHPTVLGHDNLAYSADWPGAASAAVEEALPGAVAMFALGAHADVDPRTRGLMDLGEEGQSVGVGLEAMRALGREVGEAVAKAAAGVRTAAAGPVDAASTRVELPVHGAQEGEAARAAVLERGRADALAALDLSPDAPAGTGELFGLTLERTRHLPPEERRARRARVRAYLRDRTAARFAGGTRVAVEVQALRVGPARLLALPLEPVVELGLAWRERVGAPAALLGIANGWLRYLPHPTHFSAPGGERAYEVLMSTFVPDAATRLLDAGERLHAALGAGA